MTYNPCVIRTVGLEIEGTILTREEVMRLLMSRYGPFTDEGHGREDSPVSQIYRDASVESVMALTPEGNKIFLGNRIVKKLPLVRNLGTITSGFEIITKPLCQDDTEEFVNYTLPTLSSGGEIFSPRASIHVHTGFPTILSALKNAITLGLKTEGLLYRIAGLGNGYRGVINNSIYSKPLAIPPVIATGIGVYSRLCPEKAQFAKSMEEFWNYFAVSTPLETKPPRYHPARYFGVNVYSVRLIDTIEFRFFNLSLNPKVVLSAINLCKFIAELALLSDQDDLLKLRGSDITQPTSDEDYEQIILELVSLGKRVDAEFNLSKESIDGLLGIIDVTPPFEFKKEDILTHINYAHRGDRTALDVVVGPVLPSGHVDIHNFQEGERRILDV